MSFIKPLGLLILATSCVLGGYLRGLGYHRRGSALEEARALVTALGGQLAFTLSPPAVLLEEIRQDPTFSRCDYLADACLSAKPNIGGGEDTIDLLWRRAVEKSREPLTRADRALLARLGEILGKSDLETQLAQLKLLAERLEQQAMQAREQASTQSRLCTTLGGLSGLALAILLY